MKFGGKVKKWKNLRNKPLPNFSNFSRPFDGIAYWQVYNLRHFSAFAVLRNMFQQPDHIRVRVFFKTQPTRPPHRRNHLPEWLHSESHKLTTILPWLDKTTILFGIGELQHESTCHERRRGTERSSLHQTTKINQLGR
jgi:hypothetical protein